MEPSSFNGRPKGKPQCSVTYLAGEEEALAKRKGKTLYTHKLHGCGLGGWFLLIKRQGTKRSKAEAELPTLERNTTCGDKEGITKARLSFHLSYNGFLSFSLILFQPVPPPTTLSPRLQTERTEEPPVQSKNGNKGIKKTARTQK